MKNQLTHKIITLCLLLQGYVKVATAATTTTMQEYGSLVSGNYLLADFQFYQNLFPAELGYIAILIFMSIVYILMWQKMGMLVPTILMIVFLGAFSFLVMPLGGYLFYGIAVACLLYILYKILT